MISRRHFVPAALAFALAFSGCESTPEIPVNLARIRNAGDFQSYLNTGYSSVPLETNPRRTRFYLAAVVNGVPGKFLLDTGAQRSCICQGSLKKFGLDSEESRRMARGIGGTVPLHRAEFKSFIIAGKIAIEPGAFDVLMNDNPTDFDGIIGMVPLSRLHASVDFQNDRLYYAAPDARFSATQEEAAVKAGLHVIELHDVSGGPFATGKVNGETGWFLIDTGFSQSALDSAFAEEIGLKTRPIPGVAFGFGEKHFSREVACPATVVLGDCTFQNPAMLVFDLGGVRRHQPKVREFAGMIGVEWLARSGAILDLENFRIYLEQPAPDVTDAGAVPGGFPVTTPIAALVAENPLIFRGLVTGMNFLPGGNFRDEKGREFVPVLLDFEVRESFAGKLAPGNHVRAIVNFERRPDLSGYIRDELRRSPATLVFLNPGPAQNHRTAGETLFADGPIREEQLRAALLR